MNDLQKQITDWHKETFPAATDAEIIAKIKEELEELWEELAAYRPGNLDRVIDESADVVIVLSAFLGRIGVDLDSAVRDKMNINRRRVWRADGTREK